MCSWVDYFEMILQKEPSEGPIAGHVLDQIIPLPINHNAIPKL